MGCAEHGIGEGNGGAIGDSRVGEGDLGVVFGGKVDESIDAVVVDSPSCSTKM